MFVCRVWRHETSRPQTQWQQHPRHARQQTRVHPSRFPLPPHKADQTPERRILPRPFGLDRPKVATVRTARSAKRLYFLTSELIGCSTNKNYKYYLVARIRPSMSTICGGTLFTVAHLTTMSLPFSRSGRCAQGGRSHSHLFVPFLG